MDKPATTDSTIPPSSEISKADTKDNSESDLKRVPFRFRIAAKWVLMLLAIGEKTGEKPANIVEAVVTDFLLRRDGLLKQMFMEEEKAAPDILLQLEKLSPIQIFNLLTIYLKAYDEQLDFASETKLNPESKIFDYLDSRAVLRIFQKYFAIKAIKLPSLDSLIKVVSKGYKRYGAFMQKFSVNMDDTELKEVLLKIK